MRSTTASLATVTALAVASFTTMPARAAGTDDHVLPLSELQKDLSSAAAKRAKDIEDIDRVLSLPVAQTELNKANLKPDQVKAAISTLNDEELARLADRARAAEQDVQGGLIVGLLALIGLIVVIIIVVALVA